MPECNRQKNKNTSSHISRRDFARGSVAVMGAYTIADVAAALDEPSGEAKAVKIEKSDLITALLDERYITDDDIRQVIANAEKTGRKLLEFQ